MSLAAQRTKAYADNIARHGPATEVSSTCHAVTGNAQSSEKQCVASGTRRNPMPGQSSPTPELQPQVYVHDAVVVAGRHDALAEARAQVLSL